jgi:hypothetical protein
LAEHYVPVTIEEERKDVKRKEWLLLVAALFVITAAAIGLYQYRSANGVATTAPAPENTNQTDGWKPVGQPDYIFTVITDEPVAHLWVTRDFGAKKLVEKTVPLQPNDTVLDVLQRSVKEVQTGDSGFVTGIDGLSSGFRANDPASKKTDWFYYVNGKSAEVGPNQQPVQKGDVIWWDYHSWEFALDTPAQIGAYPHPFVQRDGKQTAPPVIMAAPGFEEQAETIARSLSKVRSDVQMPIAWDEKKISGEQAVIAVGDAKAISSSAFIREISKEKATRGLFADIDEKGIHAYDDHGQMVKSYAQEGVGVVMSTLHPANRMPLWIVSGIGKSGVEKAAAVLQVPEEGQNQPFRGLFGVILADQEQVPLPIVRQSGANQ